jgi:flagellar basal-body rod protein FlgC
MMDLIPGIRSTSSALGAERVRLEVISQNIANANTTRGLDGRPYQRQTVSFESVLDQQPGFRSGPLLPSNVRVSGVQNDQRKPRMIYDPSHADADPNTGLVAMPDINIHEEMVDLIASSRAYEANLAVVRNARNMTMQTMAIAKH